VLGSVLVTVGSSTVTDDTSSRTDLARAIFASSHLTGSFLLRSGVRSQEYFDKYRFECTPAILREVAHQLVPLLSTGTQVVAGLEMGGIPIATALALETGLPAAFVRKQAKTHGTCKVAEGPDLDGLQVTVVEDVVTSGGQIVLSTQDLRAAGAVVTDALCVIDRESGGPEALAEAGIMLHALFTGSDLRPEHG